MYESEPKMFYDEIDLRHESRKSFYEGLVMGSLIVIAIDLIILGILFT